VGGNPEISTGSRICVRNFELSLAGMGRFSYVRCGIRESLGNGRIVRGGIKRELLIGCYADVDISLGTWSYNGGITLAKSRWQGVPVVKYRGQRFSSSYGASLPASSGCPGPIAESPEEYIRVATDLAEDIRKLQYYRRNLRGMTRQHGFNNASAFARKLEAAFATMIEASK
jgi:predicted O-linked N-acetylglucosamine transferase (SPINDLY family)